MLWAAWSTVALAGEGEASGEGSGETEVVVEAEREAESATSRTLDRAAVEAMPARSADDLLRAMPGLHQSAHGGHGKAYQYFLRGFDAVHGADLAVDLDGVPVNEVSNVHAHGYLDLHFVPPVLVRQVELRPGSASVEAGDFLGDARARAWLLAYDGVFGSPGALREDDLLAGEVGFYDAYPGSGGGHSSRVLGSAQLTGGTSTAVWQATAWAGWRALSLRQNFTGWYGDEIHGDGTRQEYGAWTTGASGRGWWALSPRASLSLGTALRLDLLDQEEVAVEVDGTVWEERAALSARQGSGAAWASVELKPWDWLELEPGVRGEVFVVDTDAAAVAWAPVLAPKLRTRIRVTDDVTGFLAYGRGYRSPDARGGASPLLQSRGACRRGRQRECSRRPSTRMGPRTASSGS